MLNEQYENRMLWLEDKVLNEVYFINDILLHLAKCLGRVEERIYKLETHSKITKKTLKPKKITKKTTARKKR